MNDEHRNGLAGRIDSADLMLEWTEAPWDTAVFGWPVLQIVSIEVRGPSAGREIVAFEKERDAAGCGMVSCRLFHENLRESMLLEERGFRFIEMLYQPELKDLQDCSGFGDTGLDVVPAESADLAGILDIAGSAFHNERFHVDPRLDPGAGNQRYCNWVRSSMGHDAQRLYAVKEGGALAAFFVTERLADGTCYWHLNAVAPGLQGRGYGKRAWRAMLEAARREGAQRVRTSIVARNYRVLNLYAALGFRFPAPLMTFHWVREAREVR